MTGLLIVAGVLLAALAFGGYRRLTDGRPRAVAADARQRLDTAWLGAALGEQATFVQFSSTACAPCTATRRLLTAVTADQPALAHVDIDAETRLDLVERFGITRTPTVLLLDADGVVRHRIVGAARKPELLDALEQVVHPAA